MAAQNPAEIVQREFHDKIEPLLQDYCYDCHGDGEKKGDLTLDEYANPSALLEDRKVWLRIWENLRTEMMPPAKKKFQPTSDERHELVSWIEKRIFGLDPENPDPGRVTIRRMNREEYQNTIGDVVGVRFNANDNFPPDDTGFGFDTIGDVLTISPLLMEKYLNAAGEIALMTLPLDAGEPKPVEIDAGSFKDRGGSQTARFMEADIAQTVGAKRRLDAGGQYALEVSYSLESEKGRPKGQTAKWRIFVDGKQLREIEIDSDKPNRDRFVVNLELTKGEHQFEFSIVPGEKGEGEEGECPLRLQEGRRREQGNIKPSARGEDKKGKKKARAEHMIRN